MEAAVNKNVGENPNLKGDRLNFVLLLFLYFLQAAVLALPAAISFVLQKRNVSYQDQAEFSIVGYPYAFKVLWAPIVDSVYSKRIGRRKSWLIPIQYSIGILLLFVSLNVDTLLGSEDGTRKPSVRILAAVFFTCTFLASTQDIALDAWSLTMLQKKNIGYTAPCQSIGFSFGFFLGFVGFIVLDSKDFCNWFRSVPQDRGFVTFSGFIFSWSMVIFLLTTVILVFKKETLEDSKNSINSLCSAVNDDELCKCDKIAFGPLRDVASLKLLDAGVPQDVFALLNLPSLPFQLILAFLLGSYLIGPRPMRVFLAFHFLKIINGLVDALFIFLVSTLKKDKGVLPSWYYWPLVLIKSCDRLTNFAMVTSMQAFFARISDPRYGGVYMTLLFCTGNLSYSWISTVCLWLVDPITVRSCKFDDAKGVNVCNTIFDGFYTEIIFCTLFGLLWLVWGRKQIYKLEKLDSSAYVVGKKSTIFQDQPLLVLPIGGGAQK